MLTTSGTYSWSFVTQIFHNCQPSHGSDRKIVKTSTFLRGTLDLVSSLLAAINWTNRWTRQYNGRTTKDEMTNRGPLITLQKNLMIEQYNPHWKSGCNADPGVMRSTSLCCEVCTIKRMWHLFVFLWWFTLVYIGWVHLIPSQKEKWLSWYSQHTV